MLSPSATAQSENKKYDVLNAYLKNTQFDEFVYSQFGVPMTIDEKFIVIVLAHGSKINCVIIIVTVDRMRIYTE